MKTLPLAYYAGRQWCAIGGQLDQNPYIKTLTPHLWHSWRQGFLDKQNSLADEVILTKIKAGVL